MNIFYLDSDLKTCAAYHCDKHVVKMILEYAQLLSSACRMAGLDVGYKLTHKNHPCAIWTRSSEQNYLWLVELAHYVNEEYKLRYGHTSNHKSFDLICELPVPVLPKLPWTEPPRCMPDEYKVESVVQSYRNYYRGAKADFATWKNHNIPEFMTC